MKSILRWALLPAALLVATTANAQETSAPPAPESNVCKESYEQAQKQMKPNQAESKLLVARESLRTCLRSGCKEWMVADCSKWLGEVEARIPTVVFSAKSSNGADLLDTRVTKGDGTTIVEQLDGRALEIEPGAHDFVFLRADGKQVEKRGLVREGEKAQTITAVFEAPPVEGGPITSPVPPLERVRVTPTLRYVGYSLGGAGIAGLALGSVFGLITLSKKSEAKCVNKECDQPALDDAISASTVSTVAFIAGGALLASGIALVLLSPTSSKNARVEARATFGGLSLAGSF